MIEIPMKFLLSVSLSISPWCNSWLANCVRASALLDRKNNNIILNRSYVSNSIRNWNFLSWIIRFNFFYKNNLRSLLFSWFASWLPQQESSAFFQHCLSYTVFSLSSSFYRSLTLISLSSLVSSVHLSFCHSFLKQKELSSFLNQKNGHFHPFVFSSIYFSI